MTATAERAQEASAKIARIRAMLGDRQGVRLRGIDWFAWITAGGSNAVLLAAETGVAEVLITAADAWVLTDEIEAARLLDEELPPGFTLQAAPWALPAEREAFVRGAAINILSDRPQAGEAALPAALLAAKRTLTAPEVARYREVGRLAAAAMSETLRAAQPEWSEAQLAGAVAGALLARGLQPALVLAGGARRLPLYRHPLPTAERLGAGAMLVFCARGYGLYANLTRFVSFGPLAPELAARHARVRAIEAAALARSRPGVSLGEIYEALATAYAAAGEADALRQHHQGGTTGYLAREVVARPQTAETLRPGTALAWNPSLRGAKVEDTFLLSEAGLDNLTHGADWPTVAVGGFKRPLVLER